MEGGWTRGTYWSNCRIVLVGWWWAIVLVGWWAIVLGWSAWSYRRGVCWILRVTAWLEALQEEKHTGKEKSLKLNDLKNMLLDYTVHCLPKVMDLVH